MNYSKYLLEEMEFLMSPRSKWTFHEELHVNKDKEETLIYYCAPKPYKYGFISSPSEEGRKMQFKLVIDSIKDRVGSIPWC